MEERRRDLGRARGRERSPSAIAEGYSKKSEPYHGYYFKVLKGQGPAAPLGEIDFVVKGVMIGGFALVAAPAEYRVTGVKTFIVSHDGVVYEKDLGPKTLEAFAAMERYNPDKSWHSRPGAVSDRPAAGPGDNIARIHGLPLALLEARRSSSSSAARRRRPCCSSPQGARRGSSTATCRRGSSSSRSSSSTWRTSGRPAGASTPTATSCGRVRPSTPPCPPPATRPASSSTRSRRSSSGASSPTRRSSISCGSSTAGSRSTGGRTAKKVGLSRALDAAVIYGATLTPLLFWHAHQPRRFQWFLQGDFVHGPPARRLDGRLRPLRRRGAHLRRRRRSSARGAASRSRGGRTSSWRRRP